MTIGRALTRRQVTRQRVRAAASGVIPLTLDTPLILPVYKVPTGFRLDINQVQWDLGTFTEADLLNGIALLGGNSGSYYRSGIRLAWALPKSPALSLPAIPGIETWGDEEGPQLISGEVFEVHVNIHINNPLSVGAPLTITIEGTLTEAGSAK